VFGARRSDDVGKRFVLDGLVLGSKAPVVLALVFLPGGHLELLEEEIRAFAHPVEVPA
jgi:hypothetical protein